MIEIKINNEQAFWNDFNQAFANLNYSLLNKASRIIKTHFLKAESLLFKSEGSSGRSSKWPALSPAYKKWKNTHYPGQTIMIRKGVLEQSLTSDSPNSIFVTSKMGKSYYIRLGTTSEIAEYHYKGIPSNSGQKVRKVIDPPIALLNEFARIILNEIMKDIKIHRTAFSVATETRNPSFDRTN